MKRRKVLAVILSLCLLITTTASVFADDYAIDAAYYWPHDPERIEWSIVNPPGGYKVEIYSSSTKELLYTTTLTANYIYLSELPISTSQTIFFIVYALDTDNSVLSSKESGSFGFTHTHSYEAVVTAPTCTETGYTTYTCSVCGDKYTADETEATGHTEVTDEAVEPTCTETGLTEGSHCSVCSAVIVAQTEVPATGHTEVTDLAVEPTCTETGLTEGSHCSVCNTVIVAQEVVEATGHDYEISYFTWEDGYKSATATFACANCSDEQTVNATVSVENYYGMYVHVATARYGASGATYSSVKTVGTVDMSGLETNSTSEVITEEVETEEPVEGTDTETETDEEAEAETNPTTGIVVALLPMAIALAGAVAGRKRLG